LTKITLNFFSLFEFTINFLLGEIMIRCTLQKLVSMSALLLPIGMALPSVTHAMPILGSIQVNSSLTAQIDVNAATNRVYLAGGYAVSGLQVADFSTVTLPTLTNVGGAAGGVAVNSLTNQFFSTNGYGSRVLTYNGVTNGLLQSAPIAGCGGMLDFNTGSGMLYGTAQCGAWNDVVFKYNPATNAIVAQTGTGGVANDLTVNAATGNVYINNSTGLHSYNANLAPISNGALTGSIRAANSVTNTLYALVGNDIRVFDGTTYALIANLVGAGGWNIRADTSNNVFYVSSNTSNVIRAYDGNTNLLIDSLALPAVTGLGDITTDGNGRVYVVGYSGGIARLFALGQAQVPTPGTLALLGLGFTGLIILRRRASICPPTHPLG